MNSQDLAVVDPEFDFQHLRARLQAAEETVKAIQANEVDALVVENPGGARVYSLGGADECYRTFVEEMGEGALTLAEDGTILYCNRHFAQLVHAPLESALGTSIYDFVASENEGMLRAMLWESRTTSGVRRQFPLRTREGSEVSAALVATPMTVAGVINVCILVHDLTDREARVAAEATNAAKDRFLALLSHELRTPLTPIVMAIGQIEKNTTMSADSQEGFAMIRRNIELQMRLIDDLLDLSRVTTGKLRLQTRLVGVHSLVRNVLEMLKPDIVAKKQRIECDLAAAHDVVEGDPARLQQVLWNLLKNAGKFSDESDAITIRSYNHDADALLIEVCDHGVGIDPLVIPRIFDAFEQGDHTTAQRLGGLGLGLAIAKSLVEAHGGKIWAKSEGQGRGATFTIALALAKGEPR